MRKLFCYVVIAFMFSNFMYSQNISRIANLNIPDSVYIKLEEFYIEERGDVKSHINVYNLVNKGNPIFEFGVYSFSLTGPHFPRRIFIFHNSRIFIFKSEGAFDSIGVLEEFIECIKILKIPEVDRIIYLKAISNYLEEELGQTYGADISKY